MILKRSANPCTGRDYLQRELCSNQQIKIQSNDDCFISTINGIEYFYWDFERQTSNLYHYLQVLVKFYERVGKKLPELWKDVMGSKPRQCAGSFRGGCQGVPSQVQHPSVRPCVLFNESWAMKFLCVL
ncbi:hypothetical protein TNCV_2307341 [Trichonephila clavipes]|nr:hypothetical protein TNCV_2307341 [Trichonephila clavipes]